MQRINCCSLFKKSVIITTSNYGDSQRRNLPTLCLRSESTATLLQRFIISNTFTTCSKRSAGGNLPSGSNKASHQGATHKSK